MMASEVHYRPIEAEALFRLAHAYQRTGARVDANTTMMKALHAAEAGRNDAIAEKAWMQLANWLAETGGEMSLARTSAEQAASKVERNGNDERSVIALEAMWGDVEYAAGQYEQAIRRRW